jgi:hypothetical protein
MVNFLHPLKYTGKLRTTRHGCLEMESGFLKSGCGNIGISFFLFAIYSDEDYWCWKV